MKKLVLLVSGILLVGIVQVRAQNVYQPDWESVDSRPIPGWFEDAKLAFLFTGAFILFRHGPLQMRTLVFMQSMPNGTGGG